MPVTGSSIPQHPFASHQTSECDSKEHMKDASENGGGCANGLLQDQNDGDLDRDESIYAGNGVQRNGRTTREKASSDRSTSELPPTVSLLNSHCMFSYLPAYNLVQSISQSLQTPFRPNFFFFDSRSSRFSLARCITLVSLASTSVSNFYECWYTRYPIQSTGDPTTSLSPCTVRLIPTFLD